MRKIIIIIICAVLALVIYKVASAYHEITIENDSIWDRITGIFRRDPTPFPEDPNPIPSPITDRLSVLILGIRGEDDIEDGGLLTDTMLLASIDKKTKNGFIVSIPRDLWLDMNISLKDGKPFHLTGKINEAYARGLEHGQGLSLTSQAVSRITGVPIDRAIVFDFNAFKDIVDILGGIDIVLAQPFSEPKQWGGGFSLPAGLNHLDGEKSLYYARSRYSSSDFDRARRQQEVIFAIKKKATELGFIANPVKISNLFSSLKGNLKTNVQLWEIGDMISLSKKLNKNLQKTSVLSTDNLLYESTGIKGE